MAARLDDEGSLDVLRSSFEFAVVVDVVLLGLSRLDGRSIVYLVVILACASPLDQELYNRVSRSGASGAVKWINGCE